MHKVKKVVLTLALLTAMPVLATCQYFGKLFDVDASTDWGQNIILQPDGNYFVRGTLISDAAYRWALINMQISADGNTVLSEHLIRFDDTTVSHGVNLYTGYPGELRQMPGGGYIAPISEYLDYLIPGGGAQRDWGGLIKYNASGDTVFIKTYTDTLLYYGGMLSCGIMPDGGYIIGGQQDLYTSTHPKGYLVRTDSMGDTLWTRYYQLTPLQTAQINSVIPLADGRIVVGAIHTRGKNPGPNMYFYNAPLFMLLDGNGNIIRDTIYNTGSQTGGFIYSDMNGGYITIGSCDSLYVPDPNDMRNFPSYIAHLDTNFRVTWMTSFPYSDADSHREKWLVRQLHDSSYVILGDKWLDAPPYYYGWAAKVSRSGTIVWSKSYRSDSAHSAFLRDVVEKPDGSLVFVGSTYNDTLPIVHNGRDIWLLGVDSNGCENEWCAPTVVRDVHSTSNELSIFPNPTSGDITIQTKDAGQIAVYNIQGQAIATYHVKSGATGLRLPLSASAGVYMCRFNGDDGSTVMVRLVVER